MERTARECRGIETVCGDATSYLVLRDAGMEQATSVVALTGIDDVNLEFCRLCLDRFKIYNCFSMVTRRHVMHRFTELGVQVVSKAYAVSSVLQTQLNPGKRTTNQVGLGAGEIMEVTVLAHSSMIGRPLSHFHAQAWIVGAIYRQGRLVVPHGETTVQEDDRVLLIGDPAVLPAVANLFRHGASEFPLQYGLNILVSDPENCGEGFSLPEAIHLTQSTLAQSAVVLSAPYQNEKTLRDICELAEVPYVIKSAPSNWPEGVEQILEEEDAGCLVLPAPHAGLLDWMGLGHNALFNLLESIDRPCLLARGSFPYKRILLVVARGKAYCQATDLAMDVARHFKAKITASAVLPPEFVAGQGHHEELKAGLAQAESVGACYSVDVETAIAQGHPVHLIVEQAADYDLVVLGYTATSGLRWLTLDAAHHILLRTPCSTLVLPCS